MDIVLLKEGFIVMVIGMGTVFVFLTIMIWTMNISSAILKFMAKFCPEQTLENTSAKKKKSTTEDEIALAVACAFHQCKSQ